MNHTAFCCKILEIAVDSDMFIHCRKWCLCKACIFIWIKATELNELLGCSTVLGDIDVECLIVINAQVRAGHFSDDDENQCQNIVTTLQSDEVLEKIGENGEKGESVSQRSELLTLFTNNCSRGSVV